MYKRPLIAVALAYMFEGTMLWKELAAARRLLEQKLPGDVLYQVRESSRITFYRHVAPAAMEPSRDIIEDALPLYIMYVSNAAEAAEPYYGVLGELPGLVYSALEKLLTREPRGSPVARGLGLLRRSDEEAAHGGSIEEEKLGPLYSLSFSVAAVAYVYAARLPVMRLGLLPLRGLAKTSLERLT